MKALLGSLMCLVFTLTQVFAISGGPWSGGGGHVVVTGTYAGVMVPIPPVNPAPPPPTLPADNSLALFTLKVPQSGLASGTSLVFRNGLSYSGTITAVADPDTAKLTGVISASFTQTPIVGATTFEEEYDANGQFVNTKVIAKSEVGSATSTRIRGRASITYRTDAPDPNCTTPPCASDPNGNSAGPIDYKVHGFKQSESSS